MIEDVYPLSPLQEGLYYHWLSAPEAPVYFEQVSYRVKGALDIKLFEQSYQALVARHAILRTCFMHDLGDMVLQVVQREPASTFLYQDISGEPESAVEDYKAADRARGFDLNKGSQMRLTVLGIGTDTYEFIWSHHHILMDGWCVGILISEFFQIYYGMMQGVMPGLSRVYPYAGYIAWLSKLDKDKTAHYWENYLSGYEMVSALPRLMLSSTPDYRLKEATFFLESTTLLRELCTREGITENTFIQTVWGILLGRYTNSNDVVFGAVVSGRPGELEGVESMIGLFINTIPVRINQKEGVSCRELLKEVHRGSIASLEHHYMQLAEIQSLSTLGKELFDHILVFENYPAAEMIKQSVDNTKHLTLMSSAVFEQTSYGFVLSIVPGEEMMFKFEYNSHLYTAEQINGLQQHFIQLIAQVLANPDAAVEQPDYLSVDEQRRLLETFNDTATDYPKDKTVIELFEEQVTQTPDHTALVFDETILTYRELNIVSNQLGAYLRETRKVQPDNLIGIQLERSQWMVIAVLGVLKAGGAFMPIDPAYPQDRIHYMIADSRCNTIIDEHTLQAFINKREQYSPENLKRTAGADNLAYVIYTSGSTGNPKGVMVTNASVVNICLGWLEKYTLKAQQINLLQIASISFDVFMGDCCRSLFTGGIMIVCPENIRLHPEGMYEIMRKHNISILEGTPGMLLPLLDYVHTHRKQIDFLKILIFGSDTLNIAAYHAVKDYLGQNIRVINSYGATEATIDSSYFEETPHQERIVYHSTPIGKPFPNTEMLILDSYRRLQPAGVAGEICIGGAGLARGYLNQPVLTAEKFIPHPFRKGQRLYRTGDMGRWLPDGNIEFMGRRDNQVKIRGYRIETGEIESALLSHPDIEAAVVLVKTNIDGEKELVAYLVGKEALNIPEIREHLRKTLPAPMVPFYYMQLDTLPLTPNGKLDKRNLPDPGEWDTGVEYVAPRNEIEEQLVNIWQEVLKKEKIGVKQNFFELGGHSLKLMRTISRITEQLDVKISVEYFFRHPSVEELAKYIEAFAHPGRDSVLDTQNELFF
jgi:amino acid adenylation domain-containing protein